MLSFIAWAENILKELELDWKIEYAPKDFVDGLTLFDSKVIRLTFPESKPDFALILHEICHAWTGHRHDSTFSYAFTELVRQYMSPVNMSGTLVRLVAKNGELEDENEMLKKQLREKS